MRIVLALIMALFASTGLGADWERYDNARFGYTIEVPPDVGWGRESDNGDGRAFRNGATKLAVWGGNVVGAGFESAAAGAIGSARAEGWGITYEAVTPSWASFSGTQGKRVLYQRMIALCEGQYAAFRLEYSAVDIARLDSVVNRLVRSLAGEC